MMFSICHCWVAAVSIAVTAW